MTTTCSSTLTAAVAALRQQIVFIDAHVDDYQMLATGVLPGTEVVLLNQQRNGVQQISEVLAARAGIDSIHIVSHGSAGSIQLGNGFLNVENLGDYAPELMGWAEHLAINANLMIYSCEVAQGKAGKDFIARLSELTGAAVAASSTKVGNAALGGNWHLDIIVGSTISAAVFTPGVVAAYAHILSNPAVDNGASATVGLAFGGGTPVLVSYNNNASPYIGDNKSILFSYGTSYTYESVTYDPTSLVPGAAGVVSVLPDSDDEFVSIGLGGASFNFNNISYTSLYIDNNGIIKFGATVVPFTNTDLSSDVGVPIIAAYWDDIITYNSADDQILYKLQDNNGDGNPDQLIVEWYKNGYFQTTGEINFQVVLNLNTGATPGNITVNYGNTVLSINSAPVITAEDLIGGVTELTTVPTGNLTDTGIITFTDSNLSDVHIVSPNGTYTGTGTALGSLTAVMNTDTTGTGTGGELTWTYTAAASGLEYLAAGQTKVENFTITLNDQQGGLITKTVAVTLTGTNDAPTLTAAPAILAPATEDTPYTLTIAQMLQGYTDVDAGETATLTVTAPTSPNGTFALNGAGTAYVFTPADNFNGTANISYSVVDTTGVSIAVNQSVAVSAVNDAPALTAAPVILAPAIEDTPYTITIAQMLQGYTDVDAGETATLTVTAPTSPNGTFALNGAGTAYVFTPADNFNGTANISYSVVDTTGVSIAVSQSFTVNVVNDAPILGTDLVIDFSDVAGNADLDGVVVNNTGNGLWHLSTGRGLESGHSGDDSLYFGQGESSTGGGNFDAGLVKGEVLSPVLTLDTVGGAVLSFNYLLQTEGGSSYDRASVEISQNGGAFTPLVSTQSSTLALTSVWINKTIDLSAYEGSNIQIKFKFDSVDSGFNDFEGWYIDDIKVTGTGNLTVLEDASPTNLGLPAPTDVEGGPLTITVTDIPDGSIGNVFYADGTTLVANGDILTAEQLTGLVFTPLINANGAAGSFSYSVFDGAATSSQTISLAVTPVNDAPLIETVIDPTLPTIDEDTLAPTSGIAGATIVSDLVQAGYGLGNYADPDDPTAAVPGGLAITGVNSNGILYFTTNAGDTWQSISELSDSNALILDINSYLFFQPNADYNGDLTDALTFRGWDGTGGYANGSTVNTIDTFDSSFSVEADGIAINIFGINDAPRLHANITIDLLEDAAPTSLNITAPFDPESDALTITVTGLPEGSIGKVYLANGETLVEAGATLTPEQLTGLVFIPEVNAFGAAGSFSYLVSDGSLASTQSIEFNVEAVNDPLMGSPTTELGNGTEDMPYVVSAAQLLMGFSDIDVNDVISLANVMADHGTVSTTVNPVTGETIYTITPAANYNGLVTVTYDVLSGPDTIIGAEQTFTLDAVNDPLLGSPAAVLGNGTEDTAYVVNASQLLMGFSDVDVNDASSPDVISPANVMADHGTVSTTVDPVTGETIYTITPEANYNGLVTLTYDVLSGLDTITGAQQTFTLDAVNDPLIGEPTAELPSGTEDTAYMVNASELLMGFSDVDVNDASSPDVISLANVMADHGTVSTTVDPVTGETIYTITPAANYNGLVTLTYDVLSGSDTISGAEQTFTLDAVNDPLLGSPAAVLGNGTEDTAYVVDASQLLMGFSDVDVNDASNPDVITLANVMANHGTVSTTVDLVTGETIYTITPDANYNGLVSLTYDVISGSDTISGAQQTFTLTSVNDAPVVQGSKTISVLEDSPATALGISAPTDVDGPSQTITVAGLPTAAIGKVYLADGTTLVANNQTLNVAQLTSLVFRPGLNTNGSAGDFTYVVNDGTDSSSQSITFNVTSVNDRPLLNKLASPVLNTVREDTLPTNGSTDGSTLISSILQKATGLNNFSDPDADNPGGVAIVHVSNQGTLYVSTNSGATWTAAVGVSSANALVVGINDRILFAPAANYNGSIAEAISFKSWDGHGPYVSGGYVDVRFNEGGFTSAANSVENAFSLTVDTAALSVTSVNDAPTVDPNKSLTVNEDTQISLNITAPSDVDGTVASITVTGVPTSSIGKVYLAGGSTLVNNGDSLTAVQLTGLVFIPTLNANGSAGSFSYSVSDGLLAASQTITLGVTPANDPIAVAPTTILVAGTEDQPYTVTVAQLLAGFSDPDTADAVNPNVINLGSISADHGTVTSDVEGGYTIAPVLDYNGLVTITYDVTSGPDTVTATRTFNLAAVNDAPVVDSSKSLAVLEDTLTPLAIVAPTDVDGDVLTVAINSLPINGVLYLADGETPVSLTDTLTAAQLAGLVFLPSPNFSGSGGTFSYTVSDGKASVPRSVSLSITSVNDAPVLGTIAAPTLTNTLEDATPVGPVGNRVSSIVQIGSGLANFADPDGTLPAGIAVTGVNSNGTLYYSTNNGTSWTATTGLSDSNALVLAVTDRVFFTPNANFNGAVSNALTFRAWDGFAHSSGALVNTTTDLTKTFSTDSDTISINIAGVNDSPTAALTSVSLPHVSKNLPNPAGQTVGSLFGSAFSDAKDGSLADTFLGVAVTKLTANVSQGIWQWQDTTNVWQPINAVSTSAALFLQANTRVRFVPGTNFTGIPESLEARLVEADSSATPTLFKGVVAPPSGTVISVFANVNPLLNNSGGSTNVSDSDNVVTLTTSVVPTLTKNDFNGDGRADVLWRNTNGDTYLYETNGTNVIAEGTIRNVSNDWKIASTGDFNADNKSDIVWRNNTNGQVYIYQMDGLSVVSEGVVRNVSLDWKVEHTGDFNGDGLADLLWRNSTSGEAYIYQMDGLAVVSEGTVRNVGLEWNIQGTGDFNGDGRSDILWRNNINGDVYIYQMNGTTIASEATVRNVNLDWKIEGIDDFNADGKSDILWKNDTTNSSYIYEMNGLSVVSEGYITEAGSIKIIDPDLVIAGTGDYNGDFNGDVLFRSNATGGVSLWTQNGRSIQSQGSIRNSVDSSWQVSAPTV